MAKTLQSKHGYRWKSTVQDTLHVGVRPYAVFVYIMQNGSKAPFPVADEEEYRIELAWAKRCVKDDKSYVRSYKIE